ncbi:putative T7SS-secreted protein [uncultured Microbacterium sp.]|uniref:putative T7SS-secreted protein n=1 Tax=uncultured Microbacterium sp. TaxID=191216 RepID=UPI00374842E2
MTELGSTLDPVALIPGSPDGIADAAAAWRIAGQSASQLSESVFRVSPADSWTGSSAEAFEYRRTTIADSWAAMGEALALSAKACDAYEATLRWAQNQAAEAIRLWNEGQASTRNAQIAHREQERSAGGLAIVPTFFDPGDAARIAAAEFLQAARAAVKEAASQAAMQLRIAHEAAPKNGLWGVLLTGGPALSLADQTPRAVSDRLVMSILKRLSRSDDEQVAELMQLHPEWVSLLKDHQPAPELLAKWWSEQDPAVQRALLSSAPGILGSLGGLPPAVRVAANKANAANRIDVIDKALEAPDITGDQRVELERERHYLQDAVNGEVQLYLYDPERHAVIEMIGQPSDTTSATVTYVPGTFTTMDSFYEEQVQPVARWLNQQDPNIVAFVWKEGTFPGEGTSPYGSGVLIDSPAAAGLLEANDPNLASAQAELLVDFEREMRISDARLTGTEQVGMGHSWGLVPITGSETDGVHYDQVHSLAGAGMPPGWAPASDTSYNHWGYTDVLSMAQQLGVVWDGQNPTTDAAFESHRYARDGDFELPIGDPAVPQVYGVGANQPTLKVSLSPVENHNLIASDQVENQQVLKAILRKVRQ